MSSATTEDLVNSVLEAIGRSNGGEGDADDKLAELAEKEEAAAAVDALTCDTKIFVRPNGVEYHVRKLGKHDDVALVQKSRDGMLPILTTGRPGTGKTALIEAAFASTGFYTLQGHGDTTVDDFIGSYVPISATEFEWQDGPLLRAMEEGKPLYIDEIAMIDPKVMAAPYGVMDGRDTIHVTQNPARGSVKAKPGFYVIAACNPNAPGARMSEALLSRFPIQFETKTDFKLAVKLGVPTKVVRVAQNLDAQIDAGTSSWAPQLRELLDVKRISDAFGTDLAMANLIAIAPEMDRAVVQEAVRSIMGAEHTALALD